MNPSAIFSTRRLMAGEAFQNFFWRGQLRRLHAAFSHHPYRLVDFASRTGGLSPNRRYKGLGNIPVDAIVGSLGRANDFDDQFHPLKKHLSGRWISLYLLLREDRWPPVRLYKVGWEYFVVDGHHRLSVARATGMQFIEAEVWEYVPQKAPKTAPELQPSHSTRKRASQAQELCTEPCCCTV